MRPDFRFGLTSELPVEDMLDSLRRSTAETLPVLYKVVRPYVQSVEARLKALEGIHNLLETFVANINQFFAGTKQVSYDLRQGFVVKSRGDEVIDLDLLSSGERQLLLLMCNALTARDQAGVVIIDEPEISMNVKWQRGLVQALLDCIRGSNAQMIFATHSIELLTQHRSHVVKLVDFTDGEKTSRAKNQTSGHRREADDRRVESPV